MPWAAQITGVISSELETPGQPQRVLQGVIMNIGKGGIGVVGDRLLAPGAVVRCEIHLPDSSIGIPTLLKVRWSDNGDMRGQYKIGFEFLL